MIWRLAPAQVQQAIQESGAHEGSFGIFQSKSGIIPLKLSQVRTPAANILKQELLALGGDAVTPVCTILGTEKYVDMVLLGTPKHYALLLKKLQQMPFFGLAQWREKLQGILQQQESRTILANGKILTYEHTRLMGIVNLTPDSFFADSRVRQQELVQRVEAMLEQGADIIDIGAESTRPGAKPLGSEQEQERLLPALQLLRQEFPEMIISVDTYHPDTAERALAAGVDLLNDVSGRDDPCILDLVQKYHVPWIIMHNGAGNIFQVTKSLLERSEKLGLPKDKVIWDPGIGFGKSQELNLDILRNLQMLTHYGYPVLLGASRKSVIGKVLDLSVEERLEGTLVISAQAVEQGVQILRVHDVGENFRAVRMAEALREPTPPAKLARPLPE